MQQHNYAVVFDAAAFAAWLDGPSTAGTAAPTNRDVHPVLDTAYQQHDGEAGWLVEQLLDGLRTAPQAGTPVWTYGPGVTDVRVWATAAAEDGPDGGLAGEITVDGAVLSLGKLAEKDLVPSDIPVMPGHEAAAHALSALAAQVNEVAAAYRRGRAGDGMFGALTAADIECALATLAEQNTGVEPGGLSDRQCEVIDLVVGLWRAALDGEPVDGEIVE